MNETVKEAAPLPVRSNAGLGVGVTLDDLRKVSSTLRRNAVPPHKVKDAAEAKLMTENDPAGHVWQPGEEYYRLEYSDGKYEFQNP